MNIALLFNSKDPQFTGNYFWAIRKIVFQTGIIQNSKRHMKISVGDVLIHSHTRSGTWEEYDALSERVYFTPHWALLHETRLRSTFRNATVFSMIFENMTLEIAETLHSALTPNKSYLGLKSVEFDYGPHLVFFRNLILNTESRERRVACFSL